MARKKKKAASEGAPLWVVTYGDMMSLLLTFFIILVALSEIKKEDQYRAIVEEVQKAFGMKGGGGKIPTPMDPELSLVERLELIQLQQKKEKETSHTDDPGIEGRQQMVTKVREGMKFVVGGRVTFETGSAVLSPQAERQLLQIAELIRGYNNKVELRGHAAAMEVGVAAPYPDLWSLSAARAHAVMTFLVGEQGRIRPERIRLIASADHEPLRRRVYASMQQEPNRRVEILVSESLVDDFTRPESQ